jgi:hypothetical protein
VRKEGRTSPKNKRVRGNVREKHGRSLGGGRRQTGLLQVLTVLRRVIDDIYLTVLVAYRMISFFLRPRNLLQSAYSNGEWGRREKKGTKASLSLFRGYRDKSLSHSVGRHKLRGLSRTHNLGRTVHS